jgi:sulfur carrier protein
VTVIVNGEPRDVAAGASLADVVPAAAADPHRRGVAVARNGEVVPRRAWAATPLADGDRVEIVGAVQGG